MPDRPAVPAPSDDPVYEELDEARGLYFSRLMFGWMIGPEFVERRTWDEFYADWLARREASGV